MKTLSGNHRSLAIVDGREWQNQFDLRTGEKNDENGPLVETMKQLLSRSPYPGDLDPAGNSWVTDTTLDLCATYQPQFVFMTYAQQYFASRMEPMNAKDRRKMMVELFQEVMRFVDKSGFTPVIAGRGGVTPLIDVIDLSLLDGIGVSTHWSARYAGLHKASKDDLKLLHDNPNMDRVVAKDEFMKLFGGAPEDAHSLPDFLLVAKPGYAFKALGCTSRKPLMIPDAPCHIPFHSPLGTAADLTFIRGLVDNGLQKGQKIALIILEGVGCEEFQFSYTPCANNRDWFCYEPGDAQQLAITSGKHRVLEYPPGYLFYDEIAQEEKYPLSGYFNEIPAGTIGSAFDGRSIAVGNKSMSMHMVSGADLCVECFARNNYNQGTLGVIHRQDKI